MKTPASLYDYLLPKEMIAQAPVSPRDASRLLVADRAAGTAAGTLAHRHFENIAEYLREGDLLIVNNTRVFPARLFFMKETGARIEFLFVHPAGPADETAWVALARPGKRVKTGAKLALEKNPDVRITIEGKNDEEGTCRVRFEKSGTGTAKNALPVPIFRAQATLAPSATPRKIFEQYGAVPLPPYIEKPLEDSERYQTIYSNEDGSTAAPTAGLHFTPELMEKIKSIGCRFAHVTLHIGYATFRPIRTEFAEDHPMHAEWYSVPDETAAEINRAKKAGGRVIAVGTTSVRTLESWAKNEKSGTGNAYFAVPVPDFPTRRATESAPYSAAGAWTRLYITEGFPFRAVDALITNFHLPKSTLLVLTAAFCGRGLLMRAYEEAIKKGYRFYSLGDAMLIL